MRNWKARDCRRCRPSNRAQRVFRPGNGRTPLGCFAEKPWACTLSGAYWLREGFSAGKLDYLGMQFGWFYDGYRALAPYDLRDKLKQRGYRWRPADLPNGKVWRTMTPDPEAEVAWLQATVYGRKAEVPVHEITALTRFSERVWHIG